MTDRDKSLLECPEKMCEYCCNFDREHIGMDGTALCKLTMTLAYAEDYGGNCMFYNVPKEQILVPTVNVGQTVYVPDGDEESDWIDEYKVKYFYCSSKGINRYYIECGTMGNNFRPKDIGKTVFLTEEEAEKALKEREQG